MRRLSRRKALSLVKELDAFPKVSDSYVETSASGGTGETSSWGGGWGDMEALTLSAPPQCRSSLLVPWPFWPSWSSSFTGILG